MLKKLVQNSVNVEQFAERKGNDCLDDCLNLCLGKPNPMKVFVTNKYKFPFYF